MKTRKIFGVPNASSTCYFLIKRVLESGKNLLFLTSLEKFDYLDYENIFSALLDFFSRKDIKCLFWCDDAELRVKTLDFLSSKRKGKYVVFSTPEYIRQKTITPAEFSRLQLKLACNLQVARMELVSKLDKLGFSRTPFVENKGEFAARGAVVDIYPLTAEKPYRLFFSGDEIYSIRNFEIETQHTFDFFTEIRVPAASISGEKNFFENVLPEECEIVSDVPQDLLAPDLRERVSAEVSLLADGEGESFSAVRNINFNSDMNIVEKEIKRLFSRKFRIYVYCINHGEKERISELFADHGISEMVSFMIGNVYEGFTCLAEKFSIISASEIFRRHYRINRISARRKEKFFKWSDLKSGDFVVHEDYGIGKYHGIIKENAFGEETEFLSIEYLRGDKLLVPLWEFAKVQKFVGSEGKSPRLSSMDGKRWREAKEKVRKEARELAREIIRLEAKRKTSQAKIMLCGGQMEDEFSSSFPFEETDDQRAAISAVLSDMESAKPMNRIIIGDVGFGKTEVAMRAATRCVLNFKQVALLCPTTILCQQHWRNFTERFKGFPVNISKLTRFESPSAQKKIIEELSLGVCDIIIGTHRLLQNDVSFKDLGLLIIDEEHRFGVKDKEKLKKISENLHLLVLSATPIPRTLYQSLSEIKDMSVIESPPEGRLPIDTNILPYSKESVVSAIDFELSRGGQIYYVYNEVRTIETKRLEIKELKPDLRICVVHGQMKSSLVEKNMLDFLNKKYDILLASTIIESGIDISNVNTLIVEGAHKFGLAQLYQLRGRIGRGKRKAYCYLFYPPHLAKRAPRQAGRGKETALSETAAKRLAALEEFTELGSGFRLAMRDLEIRGSGELLGNRQHGFINSIGLEMYIKILNAEVDRIKGRGKSEREKEISVDLRIPAFIPDGYVNDDMERLNFYKKILNAPAEKIDKIKAEIEDLAGKAPLEVENLVGITKLRKTIASFGVRSVVQKSGGLEIFFSGGAKINAAVVRKWQKFFGDRLSFIPSKFGDGVKINPAENPLKDIRDALNVLSGPASAL